MQKLLLKILWLEKILVISLDQKVLDKTFPLTEFLFWPQIDAWEHLKIFLESKNFINSMEVIAVLNTLTEIINFWEENKLLESFSLVDLKKKFPDVLFFFV